MTTEEEAYRILLANPDCDIDKYQKIACQNPCLAYWIAYKIPLVDFEYVKSMPVNLLFGHIGLREAYPSRILSTATASSNLLKIVKKLRLLILS